MTWAREVLHVARKDVRESSWQLFLFVATTLVATVLAVDGWNGLHAFTHGIEITGGTLPFLWIVGALALAGIVQNDAPAQVQVFWTTRPIAASANLAAKLGVAVSVLVALPVIGQAAALRAYGVPLSAVPSLIGYSLAQLAPYAAVGLMLAALTSDLKGFIVAVIAMSLVSLVCDEFFWSPSSSGTIVMSPESNGRGFRVNWSLVEAAVSTIIFLVFCWLYRVRDIPQMRALIVFVGVYGAFSGPGIDRVEPMSREDLAELANAAAFAERPGGPAVRIVSARVEKTGNDKQTLVAYIAADLPGNEQRVEVSTASVHIVSASETKVPVSNNEALATWTLDKPELSAGNTLHWKGRDQAGGVGVEVGVLDSALSNAKGATVVINAQVIVYVPVVQLQIPLQDSARLTVGLEHYHIGRDPNGPPDSWLFSHEALTWWSHRAPWTQSAYSMFRNGPDYLATPAGGGVSERVDVNSTASTETSLVLPGVSVARRLATIRPPASLAGKPVHDAAWYRHATFAVVTWKPSYKYQVRLTYVLP